jgi:hypothetical protein
VYSKGWGPLVGDDPCDANNFKLQNHDADEVVGYSDYDMCSIMHYLDSESIENRCGTWDYVLSKDCRKRCGLFPIKQQPCLIKGRLLDGMEHAHDGVAMGQRLGLSESDIRGINMRYGCKGYG